MNNISSAHQTMSSCLVCSLCKRNFLDPHLLPCLHVFCLACLKDECQGNSLGRYYCPLCVVQDERNKKSMHARRWHCFERALDWNENTSSIKEIQKGSQQNFTTQKSESPLISAFEGGEELGENGGENSNDDEYKISYKNDVNYNYNAENSSLEKIENDRKDYNEQRDEGDEEEEMDEEQEPILYPCPMHATNIADTFCYKCQQLACSKCVSSFHRRCQRFSDVKTAVDSKRNEFFSIHSNMASNLVTCREVEELQTERMNSLEEMRMSVLVEIKSFRNDLINSILAKEKLLANETNRIIDQLKLEVSTKLDVASRMSQSLQKQMDFLDLSIAIQGEGELLNLLPTISIGLENDLNLIREQYSDHNIEVKFNQDENCKQTVLDSTLGEIQSTCFNADDKIHNGENTLKQNEVLPEINLQLLTSFHGGTRDDLSDPLLTDLILLANGDLIVTDRDNKCVKKFNQSGKLLTRVVIDAVPSRIASVSHGRAVVSVMTKKRFYFLSLLGTVRILNYVPVKKIYSFVTSIGGGHLIAGTNQCDSIDLLTESGEWVKKIMAQRPERAILARPLYLTPVLPHSAISLRLDLPASGANKVSTFKTTATPMINENMTDNKTKDYTNTPSISTNSISGCENNDYNIKVDGIDIKNDNNTSDNSKKSKHKKRNKDSNLEATSKMNGTTPLATTVTSLPSSKHKMSPQSLNSLQTISSANQVTLTNTVTNTNITTTETEQPLKTSKRKSSTTAISTSKTLQQTSKNKMYSLPVPSISKDGVENNLSETTRLRKQATPTKQVAEINNPTPSNVQTESENLGLALDYAAKTINKTTSKIMTSSEIDLIVSDSGKRIFFRLRQDGSVTYTTKSTGLENTHVNTEQNSNSAQHVSSTPIENGSLSCPLGVTVHDCGLLLLADRDTDSLLSVDTETGHVIRRVLGSTEGLIKPCAVHAGTKGNVALTQVDGMVKIYRSSATTPAS